MTQTITNREAWLVAVSDCSFKRYSGNDFIVDGYAAFRAGVRIGEAFAVSTRKGKLLPSDWTYYLDTPKGA